MNGDFLSFWHTSYNNIYIYIYIFITDDGGTGLTVGLWFIHGGWVGGWGESRKRTPTPPSGRREAGTGQGRAGG